jgi:formate transporter
MFYNSPSKIAVEFNNSAAYKNSFSSSKLFVYSILGGAFIALGGLLSIVVTGGMPGVAASNPGIIKFLFGALFPLGLVFVVMAGAELFTSDCAVIPFGILNGRLKIKSLTRIWSLVYLGNFIGALLVAYLFAYSTNILSADPWLSAAKHIGEHKTQGTFGITFIKGIGANWLVCMAVWLAYAAKDITGKVIGLWFPVMCFVAFGFEHSIANMFFIPTSMMLGANIDMYHFLVVNLVPATLGNIVGGVLFVAVPYWFMFKEDIKQQHEAEEINTANVVSFNEIKKVKNHSN